MKQHLWAVVVVCATGFGVVGTGTKAGAQTVSAPTVAAEAPRPSGPSLFDELIGDLAADFRRLPSGDAGRILTIGGIGAVAARPWDRPTSIGLSGASDLRPLFSAGQTLGDTHVQMAGALTTYAIGRLTGERAIRAVGADLFRAQVVSQGLAQGIKHAVGRARPDGTSHSFPSGHSTTAFATATVLQRHFGWKAGIPAHALAAYIAASRVQIRRHFVSDVAFGAALGIVAGRSVTIGRGDARFAVAPAAGPGSASINLTLVGRD